MKKIVLCAFLRKVAKLRLSSFIHNAYTLAEVIIVMLIIAVIVAVSIGITKAKLDNVISYTYYNSYSTLREITTDMLANWDPKNPEYKQALIQEENIFNNFKVLAYIKNFFEQPVIAATRPSGGSSDRDPSTNTGAVGRRCTATKVWVLCYDSVHVACGADACYQTCWDGSRIGFWLECPPQEVTCWDGSKAPNASSCPPKISCWDGSYATSSSNCPKATCWNGSQANTPSDCPPKVGCWDGSYSTSLSSCPKATCWDGSQANTPSDCPDKIACCDGSYKTDASQCPQQQSCWDGSTVCGGSCPDKVTCWDGSFATSSSKCPSYVTCWNGEKKHNSSECPKADCWNGTQANTPSDCPPKVTCWDGSFATSSSNCPSYVTCWDGTKKYNWSECPACTNKPDPLPCGQGWDDHTCKLTGTPKTCPGGQHLNSGCECVLDCPSNLTPCQQCSNETGVVSKNPNINRTCSDETYEWSEEQCKCIISPRTLPRQGANFCKLFEANANIMGNTDVCQGSAIASNTTDFSDKKPDVTLRNGLRIYNMHNDATAIAMLEGNTQGGVYDGVPNTNAYGYTVYIDIDGVKGDSRLWSDVYPFYITLSGKVIPGYDSSANPNGAGGDSTSHMQVSVEYENYNGGKRAITWLAKSVPFKEGACLSGYVGDATPYCRNNPAVTKAPNCTTDSDSVCRVKQIKPVKFFF